MTFIYEKPKSVAEAVALHGMHGGRIPILAGGTDLIPQWKTGAISPQGFIDITGLDELRFIAENDDAIEIGALATHAMIAASPIVNKFLRALAEASATIGAKQIQNRGTIGGNVINASPAGDVPPVLAACDAEILVQGLTGERSVPFGQFYLGYRKTALLPGEMLTRIRIKKFGKDDVAGFYKIGTRRALAVSKVVMCARATIDHGGIEKIAIAFGSVAPTVVRASGTEAFLKGRVINTALIDRARHSLEDELHPIDDVRSTASYRKFVCGSLIARFLNEATGVLRKDG